LSQHRGEGRELGDAEWEAVSRGLALYRDAKTLWGSMTRPVLQEPERG